MIAALKDKFLWEKSFYKAALAIMLPIAAQNVISFGVNAMDSIMVGTLGDVAISAATLGGQPFTLLMGFGFGLSSGGSVLIAQYWGKKDLVRIRKVMRISMQFCFVVSLFITLGCFFFPGAVLTLFTDDPAIRQAGAGYLQVAALSYLPYSISNNYIMSLRGVEQVKLGTFAYAVSFFVNVFFNYCFIFGKFGFPALGVRGAAVGTVLARCTELVIALLYMYLKEKTVGFRIGDCLRFDREMLPRYIRHSLPVVGNELLWSFGVTVTGMILGHLGSVYVTANSIATVANNMVLIMLRGSANAAAVLTGKTIGEGSRSRTLKAANSLLLMAELLAFAGMAGLLLVRGPFLSLYTISPEAYTATWKILGILALVQPCVGIDITCIVGILRGGGDTRAGFALDCGCQWLVGIPLAFAAGFFFGAPAHIVYLCMKMEAVSKSIGCLIRFKSGRWIRNVTME